MIFSFFTNFPVSQRHLESAQCRGSGAGATELNHNNQVREKARKFKPIYASKILDTYSEVSTLILFYKQRFISNDFLTSLFLKKDKQQTSIFSKN